MAIYLSMHIIACMTRQALNQLIATMQEAPEIRFLRASASQMAGRLLCEFDAPDQDTLLRVLDQHHVAYEWIIREEMSWGERPVTSPADGESHPEGEATATASASPAETTTQGQSSSSPSVGAALPSTATAGAAAAILTTPSDATILHILRRLKDESAWQMIRTQHEMHSVAVLLLHDAVLSPPPLEIPMYACEADVLARGITSPLPRLRYDQIVDLIFACSRVMVW